MARVLFTMIDKTTEDIRRFEGTAFYDEYIEQLIWIVLNYIEK